MPDSIQTLTTSLIPVTLMILLVAAAAGLASGPPDEAGTTRSLTPVSSFDAAASPRSSCEGVSSVVPGSAGGWLRLLVCSGRAGFPKPSAPAGLVAVASEPSDVAGAT